MQSSQAFPPNVNRKDLAVFDAFYLADHFFSRKLVNFAFGKVRARQRLKFLKKVRQHKGVIRSVNRVSDLTPESFINDYFKKGIPVVIAGGAKEWNCISEWSFDYLAEVAGQDPVSLLPKQRTTDGFSGTREDESIEHTDFDGFVRGLKQGSGKYLRFSTMVEDHPKLAADLDIPFVKSLFGKGVIGHRIHSFIGSAESRTRLHCDFPPNLFVQVKGRKHWVLYEPAYRAVINPLLERSALSFTTNLEVRDPRRLDGCISHHMNRYETTLEPGDILFNPAYMWHDVHNLDDSIGVSIRWLSLGVHWRASWVQQVLNAFATNPPVWKAGLSKRDFNKDLLDSKNHAKKDTQYVG